MRDFVQTRESDFLKKSDSLAPEIVMPDAAQLPALVQRPLPLAVAAPSADQAAARALFDRYRRRLADETRRRHDADLTLFAAFLAVAGVAPVADLAGDPAAWAGISWGVVSGFVEWQLRQGYAIGSVNVRLSTVKVYAGLAAKAGALDADAYALIKLVKGFRQREGRRVDTTRATTRVGDKKAQPVRLTQQQAGRLKDQADPRDRLLMCLLLDHGLRVGEVAALTADAFDLDHGALTFYREKVDKTQTHRLSDDAAAAAEAYLAGRQGDKVTSLFGVDRSIRRRVGQLGAELGIAGLSPHDCRHAWATFATRAGTPLKALQDAGGWASPAMPLSYAESAAIANDGVKLR